MFKAVPKTIKIYVTTDGKQPYSDWIKSLRDAVAVSRIRTRIDRVEEGHLGQYKSLGTGLFEFKFSFGPGYRVYFAIDGDKIILLLSGGDKGSQRKDIEKAREYWTDYLMRKRK
ncbi:MAG: type II toxin-antitoxin system RelE/ParE family toxin [Bdellovibrionota bacterium]